MGWLASMLTLDHVLLEAKSVPRPKQSVAVLRSERLPVSARVVLSPLGPPGRSHEHRGPTYPLRVSAQYAPTSACTALSVPRPSPMIKRPILGPSRPECAGLRSRLIRSTLARAPCRWRVSRLSRRTSPARSETVDRRALGNVCLEAVGSSLAYSMSRRTSFPAG
jgi:hypothetical protein